MTICPDYKAIIYKREPKVFPNLWFVEVDAAQFGDFKSGYWQSVHTNFNDAASYVSTMIRCGCWPGNYPVNIGEGVIVEQ